jgi:hypothetical protein
VACVRLHLDLPRFLVVRTPNLPKKVVYVYHFPDFKKTLGESVACQPCQERRE